MLSFPPKITLDSEYDLPFDFISLLPLGATLDSVVASAIITSGPDGAEVDILEGTINVSGTVAGVRVHQGVSGCIYEITANATDTLGNTYALKGVLAVL